MIKKPLRNHQKSLSDAPSPPKKNSLRRWPTVALRGFRIAGVPTVWQMLWQKEWSEQQCLQDSCMLLSPLLMIKGFVQASPLPLASQMDSVHKNRLFFIFLFPILGTVNLTIIELRSNQHAEEFSRLRSAAFTEWKVFDNRVTATPLMFITQG